MYYLLLNGVQAGPFSVAELAAKWKTQEITPLTLYWEKGNTDWLPLHNIAPLFEAPTVPTANVPIAPSPAPIRTDSGTATPSSAEEILYREHPTLWHWTLSIFWGVVLTPVLIGIFILIYVGLARNATVYQVTNRRITIQNGVFNPQFARVAHRGCAQHRRAGKRLWHWRCRVFHRRPGGCGDRVLGTIQG